MKSSKPPTDVRPEVSENDAAQGSAANRSNIVIASAAGAKLDSHLLKGGGTDDTLVLQDVLDRGRSGLHTHLIIDGVALVRGLDVYSNTTIECIAGGGLYLADGANRAVIRNANRSADARLEQRIVIRSCFLNGNGRNQPGVGVEQGSPTSGQEADGTWIAGMQFFGVSELTLENVSLWGTRRFGIHIANATNISITGVNVDHGHASDATTIATSGTDGLHFNGNVHFVRINGARFRTGDNALALNANDSPLGPFVRNGPISDVVATDILVDNAESAIRILSGTERIDNVIINNISGSINGTRAVSISHWLSKDHGNIGSIVIGNLNIRRAPETAPLGDEMYALMRSDEEKYKYHLPEFNYGEYPLININAMIENITFSNIVVGASDDKPIFAIGPDADLELLSLDLSFFDPSLKAVPLRIEKGASVKQLNFLLNWNGSLPPHALNPIENRGGTIGQLNWIGPSPDFQKSE